MNFRNINSARIIKRNEALLQGLEKELEDSFGKDYSQKFLDYCNRHAEIETKFLGLKSLAKSELEYQVYLERMKRFRRECLIRSLFDICYLYALDNNLNLPESREVIKTALKFPTDSEIFEKVYENYRERS